MPKGQREGCGLWPAPWEVAPEQGNAAMHFLQGHVTTKNPPEPDKRKYSRNGFVVSCLFPQIPQGFLRNLPNPCVFIEGLLLEPFVAVFSTLIDVQ